MQEEEAWAEAAAELDGYGSASHREAQARYEGMTSTYVRLSNACLVALGVREPND